MAWRQAGWTVVEARLDALFHRVSFYVLAALRIIFFEVPCHWKRGPTNGLVDWVMVRTFISVRRSAGGRWHWH